MPAARPSGPRSVSAAFGKASGASVSGSSHSSLLVAPVIVESAVKGKGAVLHLDGRGKRLQDSIREAICAANADLESVAFSARLLVQSLPRSAAECEIRRHWRRWDEESDQNDAGESDDNDDGNRLAAYCLGPRPLAHV